MKITKLCSMMLLSTALCLAVSGCGSDDTIDDTLDETPAVQPKVEDTYDTLYVGTKNAFPNGYLPTGPNYSSLEFDSLGRVKTLVDGDTRVSITYTTTRGVVIVPTAKGGTIIFYDNNIYKYSCKFTLNEKGFIDHADESYASKSTIDTWDFTYDTDGHIIQMKRSEGNEVTDITYSNGDITKVSVTDEDDKSSNTTLITYTDKVNTYGIMYFDYCFRIDMDEMCYAYCAGLLGRGTKHLPLSAVESIGGTNYPYNFTWGFNAQNEPNRLEVTGTDYRLFKW